MTQQDDITQRVLTDDEIRAVWVEHGLDDEAVEDFARAIESALLSKLRAPVADAPVCQRCGGTGEADSGGIHPWGAPALIPCEYTVSAPVAESTDRAMLQSVLQDLEKSESVCPRCGHSDSCADMDVAHMIRDHLKGDASAPVAGEAQKPVAWMLVGRLKNSEPKFTLADPAGIYESVYAPLYAAPQAEQGERDE